ncbi:unnamed protein product [Caenorhabditis bovis]|uniref:Uncharacterized protein n=1 Tax=Caenorhabditis bovis TaxID=2654633 RepID=A0A8S1F4P8_9PELO|nr:unnamed protein product [Caenorhabditis bovis]
MDVICGSEITFSDGFAPRPSRTFVLKTHAPLHTSGYDAPSSGGIATFPDHCFYADRFFVWRAIGQKLYIEERSLLYTLNDNSLCIDFSRSPILPGTSITIFQENILSIVVPTAASIHRFYARLTFSKNNDTFSIISRLNEEEMIRRYHTAHVITTVGRPLRASVTQHVNQNAVAYVTAEGQIILITLNAFDDVADKHEEVTLGGSGLFNRLLGNSSSNLFSDACAIKCPKMAYASQSGIASDVVFAVTRDGWVQCWNVHTKRQLNATLDLKEHCSFLHVRKSHADDGEASSNAQSVTEVNYTIKAYRENHDVLLVIGCDISIPSNERGLPVSAATVHLVKATHDRLIHLVSYDKSSSTKKEYVIRRVSLAIDWNRSKCYTQFGWHEISKFGDAQYNQQCHIKESDDDESAVNTPYGICPESGVEALTDEIFNTDRHSFNVVHRAVQIVCDAVRGQAIRYGDWPELADHVNGYLTSSEFSRKYRMRTEKGLRLKFGATQEAEMMAKKAFWWELLKACEELEHASRGVIAIAAFQIENDLKMTAVIHKDRFTLLGDNNFQYLEHLRLRHSGVSATLRDKVAEEHGIPVDEKLVCLIDEAAAIADNRVRLMNREKIRNAIKRVGGALPEEDLIGYENGYDYESDGSNIKVPAVYDGPIQQLAEEFVRNASYDTSRPFGNTSRCIFAGSFTQSLVAANIKGLVEKRVHFALTLRALLTAIGNRMSVAATFGDNEMLRIELREIIRVYRELIEQLDIIVDMKGTKMSLCSWLFAERDGLEAARNQGGYADEESAIPEQDYNSFVGVTTEHALRATLSSTEILLIARRLVEKRQFGYLKMIMTNYVNETRALQPVIMFYRGIAYSGSDHPAKAYAAFEGVLEAYKEGNTALRRAVHYFLPRAFIPKHSGDPLEQMGVGEFYQTVVRFLNMHHHSDEVVTLSMKAIDSLPVEDDSVQLISNTLFTQLTARKEWTTALKLVLRTTLDGATRTASICELLTLMMSSNQWESIATMVYGIHEGVVEDFLREKASREPVTEKPHPYELIYAYYVARKDYRMAAASMYDFASRILNHVPMSEMLLRRRRDALASVLNMLDVLSIEPDENKEVFDDYEDTNLVFPLASAINCGESSEDEEESDGRRRFARKPLTAGFLKPSGFANQPVDDDDADEMDVDSGKENRVPFTGFELKNRKKLKVLTMKEIYNEFLICSSRVGLLAPGVSSGVPPVEPNELLQALIDAQHYDSAFDIARHFELNPQNMYFSLVREAIMIDSLDDDVVIEAAATKLGGWVRVNRRHCNAVATKDDHWSVVRGLLDAAQLEWPTDSRALRGAAEAFLSHRVPVPLWLHTVYENSDPGDYLRCLVDYENFQTAFQVVIELIDRESCKVKSTDDRTWLPYAAIDDLMKFSAAKTNRMAESRDVKQQQIRNELLKLRKMADEKLVQYFKKVENFEKAHQMTLTFMR